LYPTNCEWMASEFWWKHHITNHYQL